MAKGVEFVREPADESYGAVAVFKAYMETCWTFYNFEPQSTSNSAGFRVIGPS
jgi:hypothetical protein